MRTLLRGHAGFGALLSAALAMSAGCSSSEGAPYVAPRPGTVYHYRGVDNRIIAVDGWRTRFADSQGREGLRWGWFISDDPQHPAQIDSASLAQLWPLKVGNETVIKVKRGPEVYRWEFRVASLDSVSVPAGQYETYVVQAVEQPELVRDPRTAYTAMYTWWYAPAAPGVVRFRTKYLGGSAAGRVIESELLKIDSAGGGTSARPAGRPTPPS